MKPLNAFKDYLFLVFCLMTLAAGLSSAVTTSALAQDESNAQSAKTITLTAIVRDFCGIGFDAGTCPNGYVPHPDFENAVSDDLGLVNTTLGIDGTPVPIASFPTATVQSADSFNQWYHDNAGINKTVLF